MDPAQIAQRTAYRVASDDDIDDVLSDQVTQIVDESDVLEDIFRVINRKHGGLRIGGSPNIACDHVAGHD